MPEGTEIGGEIFVRILGEEAASVGGGIGSSTLGSGGAGIKETKKQTSIFNQMSKGLRFMGIALTAGELVRRSKIMSGTMSSIFEILGALIDIFLMPFIPLLIPLLKGMGKIVQWLAKFMVDPYGALRDLWDGFIGFLQSTFSGVINAILNPFDTLKSLFSGLKGILNPENFLPFLMGGIGLFTFAKFATWIFGIPAAFGAKLLALFSKFLGISLPGIRGPVPVPGGTSGGTSLASKMALAAPFAIRSIPIATATSLLAGAVIGGDGPPPGSRGAREIQVGRQFQTYLSSLSPIMQDVLASQARSIKNNEARFAWMARMMEGSVGGVIDVNINVNQQTGRVEETRVENRNRNQSFLGGNNRVPWTPDIN
jgi:hypothetical protein